MLSKVGHLGGFLALFLALGLGGADVAQAFERNISFCNRTASKVDVAIGFDRSGTSESTSKGWFSVQGCSCRSIVSADLRATEIFFLVTRSGLANVLSGGRAPLCVHRSSAFTFVGENAGAGRCRRGGGEWITDAKFFDTGSRTNYKLNLRAQGQCNQMDDG
jgi:uncharacterized membrane protein